MLCHADRLVLNLLILICSWMCWRVFVLVQTGTQRWPVISCLMPAPWLILRAFFSSWMRLRLIWRRFSTSAGSNWTSSCSSVSLNSTPWRCVCLCVFDGLNLSHYQYNFIWTDVLLCCLRLHICLFVYYLKCNVLNSLVCFTVYTLSHSSSPNSVIIWVAYVHSCRNIFYLGGAGGRSLMLGRGHRVCVCVWGGV